MGAGWDLRIVLHQGLYRRIELPPGDVTGRLVVWLPVLGT